MERYYMNQMFDFLRELAVNNNREWFHAHKARFQALRECWISDVDRLLGLFSQAYPELRGLTARDCLYRIYRDTRFSADKTPYKTFLSAAFMQGGRKSPYAGLYVHVSPFDDGDSGLYGGIWCPEAPILKKLRHAIVDNIEEWEDVVNEPVLKQNFEVITTERLKTAPKGWDKDHPQVEWLRMKDYGWWQGLTPDFFLHPDWPERLAEKAVALRDVISFINYSIDE